MGCRHQYGRVTVPLHFDTFEVAHFLLPQKHLRCGLRMQDLTEHGPRG